MRSTGNVYLTGLSGSGKSTVAPIVAERLGWSYVDTDELIEEATGMAVTDIFSTFGEPAFRRRETAMIEHVSTIFRELVVSLGGGAVVSGKNRAMMLESGTIVYLKASPAALAKRLASGAELRPLLRAGDDDVAGRLGNLLAERERLYEEAHVTIDCGDLSSEEIADRIIAQLP